MITTVATLTAARAWAGIGADDLRWSQLPPLPDPVGVAGAFAGVSDGKLFVAGGANFPDKMPWQGGQKIWLDTVYALDQTNSHWRVVGKLPRPLAYGVSLTTKHGVLCIGGSDAMRHYADTFLLTETNGKIVIRSLPSLPVPLANAAGALVGQVAYVAGGAETPGEQAALNRVFALDLAASKPEWRELPPCPGEARILAAAGATADAFYLLGGAALLFRPDLVLVVGLVGVVALWLAGDGRKRLWKAGASVMAVCSLILIQLALAGPGACLLYTSPSPRDRTRTRMPSSA